MGQNWGILWQRFNPPYRSAKKLHSRLKKQLPSRISVSTNSGRSQMRETATLFSLSATNVWSSASALSNTLTGYFLCKWGRFLWFFFLITPFQRWQICPRYDILSMSYQGSLPCWTERRLAWLQNAMIPREEITRVAFWKRERANAQIWSTSTDSLIFVVNVTASTTPLLHQYYTICP